MVVETVVKTVLVNWFEYSAPFDFASAMVGRKVPSRLNVSILQVRPVKIFALET